MSKKNLDGLLKRIISESATKSKRLQADVLVHEFRIDKSEIYEEVLAQVQGIHVKKPSMGIRVTTEEKIEIKKLTDRYYESLTSDFIFLGNAKIEGRSNVTYIHKGADILTVTIEPTGSERNVYDFIKKIRDPHLKALRLGVSNLLKTGITQVDNVLEQRIQGNYKTGTTERSGGLLQVGHEEYSSISERRANDYLNEIQGFSNVATASRTGTLDPVLKLQAIVNSNSQLVTLKDITISVNIRVKEHGQGSNASQGSSKEQGYIRDIRSAIEKIIAEEDWTEFTSSPSSIKMVLGEIHKQAKKSKFKKYSTKAISNTGKSKAQSKQSSKPVKKTTVGVSAKNIYVAPTKVSLKTPSKRREATSQNWLSFINIINAKLANRIKGNMTAPKLVNRTGRFAESAKVTNVETTKDGHPSFVFDYQRNPYEVFDRVNGRSPWNTPNRDPKSLVALSIREIAQELAIGRFYTRRA